MVLPLAAISGTGQAVLIAVAGTFMVWSLVTALWIPKRYPKFPRNLGAYITITVLLFGAQMGAVVWVTGTQEVEAETAQEAEAPPASEAPATPAAGDPVAGKAAFVAEGCGNCHALADAGSTGSVGPNLDTSKPSAELVVDRVTNGKGAMPAFGPLIDEQKIQDLAAYVASTAGA
jgi:mono/diheme cytochrome c family protein